MGPNPSKPKLFYVLIFALAMLCLATAIFCCLNHVKRSTASGERARISYDPGPAGELPMPDTLQYFYNDVDCRGTAYSSAEFYVKLRHPVFRTKDRRIKKLEAWIQEQTYILALENQGGNSEARNRFGYDYAAYAREVLNFWLSEPGWTRLGCVRESLAVEVVYNSALITLKLSHGGYWGGAHGSSSASYTMFDRNFEILSMKSLFRPETLPDFQKLLASEYDRQVDAFRDYDEDYKTNPASFGLTRDGCVARYESWDYAEGNPGVFIPYHRFEAYLRPEYRD